MKPFRIGAGAGYSGDRIEPAQDLAERGGLDASFTTDPAITRWRLEGGRWRLSQFVTHTGSARDIISKEGL